MGPDVSELEDFLLKAANEPLFDITFGQLRALYLLGSSGSINRAAKRLGRDYSAIKRPLQGLEEHSYELFRSRLVSPTQSRGVTNLTPAGRALLQLAERMLRSLQVFANESTKDGRFVVKVGLTTFLLSFIETLVPRLHSATGEFESRLVHLRTGAIEDRLLDGTVHCAFGGKSVAKGLEPTFKEGIVGQTLGEDQFGFVLNYTTKFDTLTTDQIFSERIPLVLPTSGVIFDFICHRLNVRTTGEIQERVNVVEWCDDVHFGFEIMRLRLHEAGMFMLKGVHGHFQRYYLGGDRTPSTRYFDLPDINHRVILAFFTNVSLLEALADHHPIQECIRLIERWIASRR
jgi:molybdenum-dependent DNA-binding transcriptional regulator ModE